MSAVLTPTTIFVPVSRAVHRRAQIARQLSVAVAKPSNHTVKDNDSMSGNATSSDGDPSVGETVITPYSSHDIFSNNVAIVAATLYCWEYLRTLPAEIRIHRAVPWDAPHLILFVLMRYTTLFAISLGLYATWHRSGGACLPFRELCTLLVQFSVSAVLGWRTVGIWQKDPRIIVIVFLLLTTLMVFSSLLVLSLEPKKLPNGACVLIDGGTYAFFPLAWFYAGTVLYDTIVIVLSTYRLWQHHRSIAPSMSSGGEDSSEGEARWTKWMRLRWNNLTPLLFRLTANGVLYLGFSTAFNIVCYVAGYRNQDHAQDLMILYSAVMWIVCQHLMLLEIKAVWRGRLVQDRLKDAEVDETDQLIARILQASWSFKAPPPMNSRASAENVEVPEAQSQELVLSLSVDSCLRAAPGSACASQLDEATHVPPPPASRYRKDAEIDPSSVHQLHDFRPPSPIATLDHQNGSSGLGLIKHPLMEFTRRIDPPDLAAPTIKRAHLVVEDVGDRDSTSNNAVSALEVADMLANMSDDAKTIALELAGMEAVHPVAIANLGASRHLSSRSADRQRAAWIIQPPL